MADWGTRRIERGLGDWVRANLPAGLAEFVMFIFKQLWAALFGMTFLVAILVTKIIWQDGWALDRYDALFIFAISAQAFMLFFRLETWEEAKVILLFHITGSAMELFKTHVGSWSYPETGIFVIGGVPMFSGFMYASIGSYIARVIRIFEMRFAPYPPFWLTVIFGCLVYMNFFSHHYLPDIRIALFAGSLIFFWRTRIWFYVGQTPRWMPMPVAAFLASFVVWIAENIGSSLTGTWVYAGQLPYQLVSFSKMGSWYLLLWVAFVTVTFVSREALIAHSIRPEKRSGIIGRDPSPN